jgi:hypothetical protein
MRDESSGMKNTPKTRPKIKPTPKAVPLDLDPDAWPKFEALVKSAAKMGHKSHDAPAPKRKRRTTG